MLQVDDIGLQRLALHLLGRPAVVVGRSQIPRRHADLGFTWFRVRIGRAKHGPVLSDEHSTLGPGAGRHRKRRR